MTKNQDIGSGSLSSFGLSRPRRTLRFSFRQLVDLLITWQERARQRRHLASFDQRMLRDIGLSRVDVEQEIRKPFWRI